MRATFNKTALLTALSATTLSATTLSATAFAQGADSCTMAQVITGNGPFNFDTSAATTDGLPDVLCDFSGNMDIFNDVWFSWTATVTGPTLASFCNGTATGDTKIAVYTGGCAGTVVACNDDSCTLLSEVSFSATAGTAYLLRVGNFSTAGTAIGDFTVAPDLPILNPANGHYYKLYNEQLSWTDAEAAAQTQPFMGMNGHLATLTDQAEVDWVVQNLSPGRPWIGLSQNLSSPTYSEPGGGFEWVTGEPFSYTNWSVGEPSNTNASGGSEEYVEMFGTGVWNDTEDAHSPTVQYLVEWDGLGSGLGTNYCMAVPNSTGVPARISATGSANVANNNLTLVANNMPLNSFGYLLTSRSQGNVPMAGTSVGTLCLSGSIGRYIAPGDIMNSGSAGSIAVSINNVGMPTPTGPVSAMPGETWNFQFWHRDSVNGMLQSNFTDGLEVTLN